MVELARGEIAAKSILRSGLGRAESWLGWLVEDGCAFFPPPLLPSSRSRNFAEEMREVKEDRVQLQLEWSWCCAVTH